MSDPAGKIVYYIQKELANGRQPSEDGFYIFTRKELIEGAEISASTFNNCKAEVVQYFSSWCDLKRWAKYDEYAGKKEPEPEAAEVIIQKLEAYEERLEELLSKIVDDGKEEKSEQEEGEQEEA